MEDGKSVMEVLCLGLKGYLVPLFSNVFLSFFVCEKQSCLINSKLIFYLFFFVKFNKITNAKHVSLYFSIDIYLMM